MKIRNCFASMQLRITTLRKYPIEPKAYLGRCFQGFHRLEKYLNIEGFLEKSLKTKSVLKSTGE